MPVPTPDDATTLCTCAVTSTSCVRRSVFTLSVCMCGLPGSARILSSRLGPHGAAKSHAAAYSLWERSPPRRAPLVDEKRGNLSFRAQRGICFCFLVEEEVRIV